MLLLAIREKVTGVVALVFVGVIALFMIVPMLYQYVAGFGSNDALDVNGESVSLPLFNARLANNRQRLEQAFGGNIPEYFNQNQFLVKQTVDSIVQDKLLNQATLEDGYRVSREDVAALIKEIPEFQKDGEFDRDTYHRELQSRGYNEALFESDFARQYLHGQLQEGLVKSAFVDPAQLQAAAALQNQSRDFAYVRLLAEEYRKQQSVTDDELAAYHAENAAQFQHPEKASLDFVRISLDDYKQNIDLDEADIKAEYEAGIEAGRYTTPETRKARHILIKVAQDASDEALEEKRQEALALIERLKAGEDFATLAKEHSADPGSAANGGDLGEVQRGVMVPAFEEAVYAQALNEIGEPVKTRFGFHIIRVDAINAAVQQPFAEVEQAIRDELLTNQAREEFAAVSDEAANLAFENPDSLQPVVDELNLKLENTGWFTRSAGTGIAAEAVVRDAAFHDEVLIDGNNSGALALPDGDVVIVRIKQHEDAHDKSLAEAKADIEAILLDEKTEQALDAAADALEAALLEGRDFAELAAEQQLSLEKVEAVTRQQRQGLDNQLVQAVFRLGRPAADKPAIGRAKLGADRAVLSLTAVAPGDYEALEQAEKDRLSEQLLGAQGNADYQGLLQDLRAKADVVINPQLTADESM